MGRRIHALILLSTVLSFCDSLSYGQRTCDSLILLKQKVYGFRPGNLSDSLRNLKNNDLDLFWNTAHNNPKEAAQCLKILIENERTDLYFCWDASALLSQLDTTDIYFQTIIEGLNKAKSGRFSS